MVCIANIEDFYGNGKKFKIIYIFFKNNYQKTCFFRKKIVSLQCKRKILKNYKLNDIYRYMKKNLLLTQNIIEQAERISEVILNGVASLSSANPVYRLSRSQLLDIFNIGSTILIVNCCTMGQVADEYTFEGFGSEHYKAEGDGCIQLGLQLLCAIWESNEVMLGWYRMDMTGDEFKIEWEFGDGMWAMCDDFFRN